MPEPSSAGRPAVVVTAFDIEQTNTMTKMIAATGRFLDQPHVQASPHYADTRRCFDHIVAVFSTVGEKLAVQLSLEQMGLEDTAGKPILVLGASDSAQRMLAGQDLTQWLRIQLEHVGHGSAG